MKKDGLVLVSADNCGGPCVINVLNTSCVIADAMYECQKSYGYTTDCPQNKGFEIATPISYTTTQNDAGANLQYWLRDSVLLNSKKGITYASMYYYLGSKMDASFLTANFLDIYDVVMQNAIPIIQKINDPTYTGALYNSTDLAAFNTVIHLLRSNYGEDVDVSNFLTTLENDLNNHVNENKNTILSAFATAE